MSGRTVDPSTEDQPRVFIPEAARGTAEPEPIAIPDGRAPVAPFDPGILPERLRPWIEDIADRTQCPPDYLGAPSLVVAGSILGCTVALYPKCHDDWHEFPNLWGAIVGRPGAMKSPALKAVMQPLHRLAKDAIDVWETRNEGFLRERLEKRIRSEAAKANALKNAKGGREFDVSPMLEAELEGEPPAPRRFILNDASYEALCERCRENPSGLLLYQDELMGLVRRAEDTPGMRELLLGGWSTLSNLTLDRIGRGRRTIPRVCLAVLGSIQPGKLLPIIRGTVRGGEQGDGWLQRFSVLVWPDVSPDWENIDRRPDSAASDAARETFQNLAALSRDFDPADDSSVRQYRFEADALECFVEWHIGLETDLRRGDLPEALESHRSKYRKLIPAVALISELCDNPGASSVRLASLKKAMAWGAYLWTHAERVYGSAVNSDIDAARFILKRLKNGDISGEFSARDVYRKGWSGLTEPQTVEKGCARLVDLGWLAEREQETGGRPAWLYRLTSGASTRFASNAP